MRHPTLSDDTPPIPTLKSIVLLGLAACVCVAGLLYAHPAPVSCHLDRDCTAADVCWNGACTTIESIRDAEVRRNNPPPNLFAPRFPEADMRCAGAYQRLNCVRPEGG